MLFFIFIGQCCRGLLLVAAVFLVLDIFSGSRFPLILCLLICLGLLPPLSL